MTFLFHSVIFRIILYQGEAKFDKAKHNLAVSLPVKAKEPVERLVSVDSGIGLEFDENDSSTQEDKEVKVTLKVSF